MGSPADFTIIVLAVAIGVGLWTVLDRLTQVQRDVELIKRRLDLDGTPPSRPEDRAGPSL